MIIHAHALGGLRVAALRCGPQGMVVIAMRSSGRPIRAAPIDKRLPIACRCVHPGEPRPRSPSSSRGTSSSPGLHADARAERRRLTERRRRAQGGPADFFPGITSTPDRRDLPVSAPAGESPGRMELRSRLSPSARDRRGVPAAAGEGRRPFRTSSLRVRDRAIGIRRASAPTSDPHTTLSP